MIDLRAALREMRKVTPSGDPIPFSLGWFEAGSPPHFENAGKFREEFDLILCGQLDDMKGRYIDVRYSSGGHHDTRILLTHIKYFNEMEVFI
jgi:hypothetical protein